MAREKSRMLDGVISGIGKINGIEVEVNEKNGKAFSIKRINMSYDEI